MELLTDKACPACNSQEVSQHTTYNTQNHGQRRIYCCDECGHYFSETSNTFMAGIKKPLSLIVQVIKARAEGTGLNAACRVFDVAKNTIINWENRFAGLKQTLLLYALLHTYLQLIIEGDEVYTKVRRNTAPDASAGWTVVLMDRASRFLVELKCGRKDRELFMEALKILEAFVNQSQDLSLITDGERRYSSVLFDICHDLIRNGKRGRPRKTLRKNVKVRVKNKGSQARKRGPRRPKYQAPCPEHPDTVQNVKENDIHANHCEGFNSSLRRRCSAFCRKTNTYAKSDGGLQRTLNVYWVVHNFIREHFTTKAVPAVALGIIGKALSWTELFMIPIAS